MGNSKSKSVANKKASGFQLTRQPSLIISDDILKQIGELSEEKLAEIRTAFKLFDKDNDHCIDASELKTVLMSMGHSPSAGDVEMMVTMVDIDNSGTIDFEEFVLMVMFHARSTTAEEDMLQAFRVFDSDDDGRISCAEFKQAMMTRGDKMTEDEAEEMVRDADIHAEGVIDYEKFVKLMCAPVEAEVKESISLMFDDDYNIDY